MKSKMFRFGQILTAVGGIILFAACSMEPDNSGNSAEVIEATINGTQETDWEGNGDFYEWDQGSGQMFLYLNDGDYTGFNITIGFATAPWDYSTGTWTRTDDVLRSFEFYVPYSSGSASAPVEHGSTFTISSVDKVNKTISGSITAEAILEGVGEENYTIEVTFQNVDYSVE